MAKNKLSKAMAVSAPEVDMRYRAQDALRTISQAEEYRRDKPLMKEVKRMAKQQAKAVCK